MTTTTKKNNDARSSGNWQGMNWIRQEKRLAIYIRDGLSCAYCGSSVEDGVQLSLDHLRPHSKGGSNDASNLVTCCSRCNSSRGTRSVRSFCASVAGYINHGIKATDIERHVRNCSRRDIKAAKIEAKVMIERRGSAAKVIANM